MKSRHAKEAEDWSALIPGLLEITENFVESGGGLGLSGKSMIISRNSKGFPRKVQAWREYIEYLAENLGEEGEEIVLGWSEKEVEELYLRCAEALDTESDGE